MLKPRPGISPIMAELLLLALVSTLGIMLFTFTNVSIGGVGSSFNALLAQRGTAVAQQPAIEFVRFHGSSPGLRDTITVFVRNVGIREFNLQRVVVQNVTPTPSNQPFFLSISSPDISCSPTTTPPCLVNPGTFTTVTLRLTQPWEAGVTYSVTVITEQAVRVVEHAKP
jgi:hypothetical protein